MLRYKIKTTSFFRNGFSVSYVTDLKNAIISNLSQASETLIHKSSFLPFHLLPLLSSPSPLIHSSHSFLSSFILFFRTCFFSLVIFTSSLSLIFFIINFTQLFIFTIYILIFIFIFLLLVIACLYLGCTKTINLFNGLLSSRLKAAPIRCIIELHRYYKMYLRTA